MLRLWPYKQGFDLPSLYGLSNATVRIRDHTIFNLKLKGCTRFDCDEYRVDRYRADSECVLFGRMSLRDDMMKDQTRAKPRNPIVQNKFPHANLVIPKIKAFPSEAEVFSNSHGSHQTCLAPSLASSNSLSTSNHILLPISPDILELPSPSSSIPIPPSNNQLQEVIKLGEGFLPGPEDVAVDEKGVLYTATRDGWIRRLHRNGSWEDWMKQESSTLLGITTAKRGGLIVCDCEKGLLKFTDDGVTVLASHVHGSEIRFADDAIEASDGSVYFSVASTKFQLHNWNLDVLEAKPYGQLLKYDPETEETSILLDGLYFANGVALSEDEDFLLVVSHGGESKGKTEIFIENLPGAPDNINLAPDGSFWIALLQVISEGTEFVHTSRALKLIISNFPKAIELVFSGLRRRQQSSMWQPTAAFSGGSMILLDQSYRS
ncbi:hypothetical protein GQ457_08G003580 [Hibiscus cannabinus]